MANKKTSCRECGKQRPMTDDEKMMSNMLGGVPVTMICKDCQRKAEGK